jgi:hypothetical protein
MPVLFSLKQVLYLYPIKFCTNPRYNQYGKGTSKFSFILIKVVMSLYKNIPGIFKSFTSIYSVNYTDAVPLQSTTIMIGTKLQAHI